MLVRKAYLEIPLRTIYLTPGHTGDAVFSLQNRLKILGLFTGDMTGVYDTNTQKAIQLFQEANGLPIDGVTGWKTYLCLWRDAGTEVSPVTPVVTLAASNASLRINRSARSLSIYQGNSLYRQYPIAVGKPGTPTPLGDFAVATKIANPGGILGTRWMGLNYDAYGIHGTNRPWLIGQAVSLGCIRMHNADIEEVFNLVRLGTSVHIRE
jgi:peptidoglycan hydrolase-like protein with peptidoglycan-binding domain